MSSHSCAGNRVHTVTIGLMFVLSGVALMGAMRGWGIVEKYWAFWPLIFVLPAIGRITAPPGHRDLVASLGWLGLSAILLAANLGYFELRIRDLVPIVLVFVGARLLLKARGRSRGPHER